MYTRENDVAVVNEYTTERNVLDEEEEEEAKKEYTLHPM